MKFLLYHEKENTTKIMIAAKIIVFFRMWQDLLILMMPVSLNIWGYYQIYEVTQSMGIFCTFQKLIIIWIAAYFNMGRWLNYFHSFNQRNKNCPIYMSLLSVNHLLYNFFIFINNFRRSTGCYFSTNNRAENFPGESTEKHTRDLNIYIYHNSHILFFLLEDLMISLMSFSV